MNDVDHLYIFSDGAKNTQNKESVRRVRDIVSDIDWCKKTIISHERNIGLARSLITVIDRVFEDNEQIIVLEEDCVPPSDFVSFMRRSLKNIQIINK
jgi:hypothetical protein